MRTHIHNIWYIGCPEKDFGGGGRKILYSDNIMLARYIRFWTRNYYTIIVICNINIKNKKRVQIVHSLRLITSGRKNDVIRVNYYVKTRTCIFEWRKISVIQKRLRYNVSNNNILHLFSPDDSKFKSFFFFCRFSTAIKRVYN